MRMAKIFTNFALSIPHLLLHFILTMSNVIHPLYTDIQPPKQFTFPFCYAPHPLCELAAEAVQRHIRTSGVCDGEGGGKMFGVLVVRNEAADGQPLVSDGTAEAAPYAFLAAYSGLLSGRNDWTFFVPPVFDAQRPDGHFKLTEAEISALNHEVDALVDAPEYKEAQQRLADAKALYANKMAERKADIAAAKARRDERRASGPISKDEEAAMIKESQYMKAELRRFKKESEQTLVAMTEEVENHRSRIEALRHRRSEMSDKLQKWLFSQYRMLNARGEIRDITDIFLDKTGTMPPAGTGDCCAPKLLQYAYSHGLQPLCMAEFWWGDSPRQEIRHHLHYYPACRSKCLPVLTHMLIGLDVEPNPLQRVRNVGEPRVVFEDEAIIVVDKPSGMLSVPGKEMMVTEDDSAANVEEYVKRMLARRHAEGKSMTEKPVTVKAVHRLDMDTSGLLVLALNDAVYTEMQRQFASREVKKRYEALLDGIPKRLPDTPFRTMSDDGRDGRITLPLSPDLSDRPRQQVDYQTGKPAVTDFHVLRVLPSGVTHVSLTPHTGRTHQLRVHCAHPEGLATPILGDPLYGRSATRQRMYLHAASIEFRHPVSGETIQLSSPSNFKTAVSQSDNNEKSGI